MDQAGAFSRESQPPRPTTLSGSFKIAPRLHRFEVLLLVVISSYLCFLPWLYGSMSPLSQQIGAGLAFTAFFLALIPRCYSHQAGHQASFQLIMWPKLLRFPIFWLGLLLLIYITLQGLNPSWEFRSSGKLWWLHKIKHITWLPTGLDTPYLRMNAWRMLTIYGSAWLLVCALWVGVTRRKSILILVNAIVINATLLAIIGIAQKIAGNGLMLWKFDPVAPYFVSTFIYKNHAGTYFNLVLAATTSLALWHTFRAKERLARSSPAPLYAFCAVVIGGVILLSGSRGAILLLSVQLLSIAGVFLIWNVRRNATKTGRFILCLVALGCLILAGLSGKNILPERTAAKFDRLFGEKTDVSVSSRRLVALCTWQMAKDKLLTGWGAGGYRFYFPVYQKKYPEIMFNPYSRGHRLRWEYAHCDYLQFLAEVGLIGTAIAASMGAAWLVLLRRIQVWRQPACLLLLGGVAVTLIHSLFDFGLYNPAVLVTCCAFLPIACRWTELAEGPK